MEKAKRPPFSFYKDCYLYHRFSPQHDIVKRPFYFRKFRSQ